ncbi:hypothetical protein EJB05_16493, partial [Eragrostis curvula]
MTPCSIKRRRMTPREPDATAAGTETWASLHQDLLHLIGSRAATCATTCASAPSAPAGPRAPSACAAAASATGASTRAGGCCSRKATAACTRATATSSAATSASSTSTLGAFVRVRIPLLDGHVVLDSVDGLLLLCRIHDTAVRLVHPFTGDVAELPPLAPVLHGPPLFGQPQQQRTRDTLYGDIQRVCAAVDVRAAAAVDDDITVMLLLFSFRELVYANVGDQQWTLSTHEFRLPRLRPVSHQGRLFFFFFFSNTQENCAYIAILWPRLEFSLHSRRRQSNDNPKSYPGSLQELSEPPSSSHRPKIGLIFDLLEQPWCMRLNAIKDTPIPISQATNRTNVLKPFLFSRVTLLCALRHHSMKDVSSTDGVSSPRPIQCSARNQISLANTHVVRMCWMSSAT